MRNTKTTTLDNGIRIITDSMPHVDTLSIGIWTATGGRHENPTDAGAAHMVEHMLFKGTKNRDSLKIVKDIENVGGHMNAYTSREITSYHVQVLKDDMPLAMDVLSDMYAHSTMPEDEVERERHVILQEIGMVQDTPDDLVFDNFYEAGFKNQRLGKPILGTNESIENMQRTPLMNHVQNLYSADRTIISAAGNLDHDKIVQQAQKHLGHLSKKQKPENPVAKYTGGDFRDQRDLEQTHIVLGFEGVSMLDEEYYTAQILTNILGGGMSSRLFQEVREKRGLCYSIYAFHSGYTDAGLLGIYAGTGPDEVIKLMPVICEEALKLANTITEEEITRARAQMKSSLLMSRESTMRRANQQAKFMALRNQEIDLAKIVEKIDNASKDSISKIAEKIFKSAPTLSALGPLEKLESYEKISERMAA